MGRADSSAPCRFQRVVPRFQPSHRSRAPPLVVLGLEVPFRGHGVGDQSRSVSKEETALDHPVGELLVRNTLHRLCALARRLPELDETIAEVFDGGVRKVADAPFLRVVGKLAQHEAGEKLTGAWEAA